MAVAGSALSAPATRRSVRRRAGFALAVTMASIALLVWAVSIGLQDRSANALQDDGVRTDAAVTSITSVPTGRGAFPAGSATVQFQVDGEDQQATIDLGTGIADVEVGQTLAIVFDPSDPSRAEIQGERATPSGVPFVPVAFMGLVTAGMAVVAIRHVVGLRRVLASGPWMPVSARVEQVPVGDGGRDGTRTVVKLGLPDGSRMMETIGLNRLDPGLAPEAWVVGLSGRRTVVATPGGGHVTYVRAVRKR